MQLTFTVNVGLFDTNNPPERCRKLHDEWFKLLRCPLLRIDGTKPVGELLSQIAEGYL